MDATQWRFLSMSPWDFPEDFFHLCGPGNEGKAQGCQVILSDEEGLSGSQRSPCHLREACSGLAAGRNHTEHSLL